MKRTRLFLVAALLLLAAAALFGWKTYPGAPRWPLVNGFHYVANLHPSSFPSSSPFTNEALYSLSDIREVKGTSFYPGYIQNAKDPLNNNDGFSTWAWVNRPNQAFLGLTTTRFQGSNIVEADILLNNRKDYQWTTKMVDPSASRSFWPVDLRSLLRGEVLHAVGLDNSDTDLCNVNTVYDHGAGVPHVRSPAGVMPHADDKGGIRTLYPSSTAVVNVMATSWREPTGSQSGPRVLSVSGVYNSGASIKVPCYLENQGTQAIPTGPNGVKAGVYLSSDNIITTLDARLGEFTFTRTWPAHASYYHELKTTVSTLVPSGNYYVGVIFDSGNLLNEIYETDNSCYLGTIKVQKYLDLTSVWPIRGPLIGDEPVTLFGDGFMQGQIQVQFGGQPATQIQVNSITQLTCRTPMYLTGGAVDVTVIKGSTRKTLVRAYTYLGGDVVVSGNPRIGVPFSMGIDAPTDPGATYVAAASLSAGFGIPLGVRTFPLDPDPLFVATANNWLPQIFGAFRGVLNTQGRAVASIHAPADPRLVGQSIHVAFLTLDSTKPFGVRTISKAKKLTIAQ
jgi:hypothetical protein